MIISLQESYMVKQMKASPYTQYHIATVPDAVEVNEFFRPNILRKP